MTFDEQPIDTVAQLDSEANGGRHTIALANTPVGPVIVVSEDHGHGVHQRRFALSSVVHLLLNIDDAEFWTIEARHAANPDETEK